MLKLSDDVVDEKTGKIKSKQEGYNHQTSKNANSKMMEEKGRFKIEQTLNLKVNFSFFEKKAENANGGDPRGSAGSSDQKVPSMEKEQNEQRSKLGKMLFFYSNKKIYLKN